MTLKVWIHVDSGDGGAPQRVCWYMGTSDLMLENAIRMHLHLPRQARFLLRDMDGDLVPVSATLPHDHTFQLVLVDNGTAPESATAPTGASGLPSDSDHLQRPRRKRRRVEQRAVAAVQDDSLTIPDAVETPPENAGFMNATGQHHSIMPVPSAVHSTTSPMRPRSMVYLVTRFLETFTCAISNDDNINFIPSTGPYALYALYRHLFADPAYHPRSPNGFYKMTSMQGKIDRQRVIRYYRSYHENRDREGQEPYEYVVSKPEGKGPLLRKYVDVGTDVAAADLVRSASFVHALDLDPQLVVAKYSRFLEGFLPIAKAEYQAHTRTREQQQQDAV